MRLCALLAAAALGAPAFATVMGFNDDLTDGAFDPVFAYDFSSDFAGNGPGGDFNSLDPGVGLCLCSDEVFITFPGAGMPVGLAQVDLTDFTGVGATEIEFIGTLGSLSFSNAMVSMPESFVAGPSDGIGAITAVRVSAFETFVTRVSIRTIPTPGGLALAGVAGLALVRRRR